MPGPKMPRRLHSAATSRRQSGSTIQGLQHLHVGIVKHLQRLQSSKVTSHLQGANPRCVGDCFLFSVSSCLSLGLCRYLTLLFLSLSLPLPSMFYPYLAPAHRLSLSLSHSLSLSLFLFSFYICMYACMYVCIPLLRIPPNMYVCMQVCMYVCVCRCIGIYMYILTNSLIL